MLTVSEMQSLGKVKVFRCRICQEAYIGEEPPSRCPFCGATADYIIPAEKWDMSESVFEISSVSKANLEAALKLELDNTAFYLCAANAAQEARDDYAYAKFKILRKVENEHAEVIARALQISLPALEKIPCSEESGKNSQEGWERESRAIKAYSEFAETSPEPQMKELFNALVEIETDHLELHKKDLEK